MPFALTMLLLHASGAAAGYMASQLGIPLAWMIGPMLSTVALALILDARPPPRVTRMAGQIVVGALIGLFLTPEAVQRIADNAAPMLISAFLIVLIGCAIGYGQARLARTDLATAVFSCVPGGPAEMANLAIRHGGDGTQAAFAQSLRIVAIVILFPPLLALQGGSFEPLVSHPGDTRILGLLTLLGVATAAGWLARALGLINPYFLGPMLASGALAAFGVQLSAIPAWLVVAAQILLGVSLGAMFRRSLFSSGASLAMTSVATTGLLLALCVGIAFLQTTLFGQDLGAMMLGNAPGSVTEMAITAQTMQLDVSLVAAFHMLRIFVTMTIIPVVWRMMNQIAR